MTKRVILPLRLTEEMRDAADTLSALGLEVE